MKSFYFDSIFAPVPFHLGWDTCVRMFSLRGRNFCRIRVSHRFTCIDVGPSQHHRQFSVCELCAELSVRKIPIVGRRRGGRPLRRSCGASRFATELPRRACGAWGVSSATKSEDQFYLFNTAFVLGACIQLGIHCKPICAKLGFYLH